MDHQPPPGIFLVEDEAIIAMDLGDRLRDLGYVVCGTATRGEKALEDIPVARPDIVLMDIRLAGRLNGIETAGRLRESFDVPVVFLTAYSDPELLQRASEVDPYGYLVKPFEERELHATIQMALYKHRMGRFLKEANVRLEKAVAERTAELRSANRALRESEASLRALAGSLEASVEERTAQIRALLHRLVDAQESERRKISSDLHDLIGQNLSVLSIEIANLRTHLTSDRAFAESSMDGMAELIQGMAKMVRTTIADLRPPLLDDYGLAAAVELYGRETERRAGVRVVTQSDGGERRLSQAAELMLFRIAQEAVTNALKHSKATRILVSLSIGDAGVRLAIEDDGSGFDPKRDMPDAGAGGWGLKVMRERAEALGGALRVEFPGTGTRIVAEVPLENARRPG